MKRLLFIAFFGGAFSYAFADGSPWRCTTTSISGNTPQQVNDILSSHYWDFKAQFAEASASALSGLPVDTIVSVAIAQRVCKWVAPSKCQPSDPRLTVSIDLPSGCHASGSCWITNATPGGDPCSSAKSSATITTSRQ